MLADTYSRRFSYLRLSLTKVCNFRCPYCLPHGYQKTHSPQDFLSVQEIRNLLAGFVELGFTKVRLTGGEPTVRSDFLQIVEIVRSFPQIKKIALTTNGFRLKTLIEPLKNLGVTDINVSVDSLRPETFHKMTGHNVLADILEALKTAQTLGFENLKINAVLMKDINASQFSDFVEWTRTHKVTVRFIELMQTPGNKDFFKQQHLSNTVLEKSLQDLGWSLRPKSTVSGPANEFVHPDYQGAVGFISPYGKDFCKSCNRLRVSAEGGLKLCLFGDGEFSLRPWLKSATQKAQLVDKIQSVIGHKQESHLLTQNQFGNTENFSVIGG